MNKLVKVFMLGLFFMLGLYFLCFAQEQITITTYYPSPFGSYRELTAHRMKIGLTYSGSGTSVSDNNLIVEGSVGIGTDTPGAYRLYVNGDMYVNGDITTDADVYPDYVFEPDYELMPLDELKKFVSRNKHLPKMPSTQEVKKEGVKIFEQNRMMLEKLEEAYLYIMELQERIAKLESALEAK